MNIRPAGLRQDYGATGHAVGGESKKPAPRHGRSWLHVWVWRFSFAVRFRERPAPVLAECVRTLILQVQARA